MTKAWIATGFSFLSLQSRLPSQLFPGARMKELVPDMVLRYTRPESSWEFTKSRYGSSNLNTSA